MKSNLSLQQINHSAIDGYIHRYQLSTKNAVESILNMGEAVFGVYRKYKSHEISEKELNYFCSAVGLDSKGPTFRKYKAIGQNAKRFREVMDKLPSTFTTLYEIATLEAEDFEKLIANQSIKKSMTFQQFKNASNKLNVLRKRKLTNPPVRKCKVTTLAEAIRKINRFSVSLMRDVPESKFNEFVALLTLYKNEGWLHFEDPEIIEFELDSDNQESDNEDYFSELKKQDEQFTVINMQ